MGVLPLALLAISNIIVGVWGGMVKIGRCLASAGVRLEFFIGIPAAVSSIINGNLDVITGPTQLAGSVVSEFLGGCLV